MSVEFPSQEIVDRMTVSFVCKYMEEGDKYFEIIAKHSATRYLIQLCYSRFVRDKQIASIEKLPKELKEELWQQAKELSEGKEYKYPIDQVRINICSCIWFLKAVKKGVKTENDDTI